MTTLIILWILSILLSILGLFRITDVPGLLLSLGLWLGILCIPFSIMLFKKAKERILTTILTSLFLSWGVICLGMGVTATIRAIVRFAEKKYIAKYYSPQQIPFLFKDYFKTNTGGIIKLDSNWRQVLVDKYWSVETQDFVVSQERKSHWAVNGLLDGMLIDEIEDNSVLFVEMDSKDKTIVFKEDFLSQQWDDNICRRIILFNGVTCEYCGVNDSYKSVNTDNYTDCNSLKWE